MKKYFYISVIFLMSVVFSGCENRNGTAQQQVQQNISKAYNLTPDERALAEKNAKSYYNREWIQAGNKSGQFTQCYPDDSNKNGLVSCFGQLPQAPNGDTYREVKMYCGYTIDKVGCRKDEP